MPFNSSAHFARHDFSTWWARHADFASANSATTWPAVTVSWLLVKVRSTASVAPIETKSNRWQSPYGVSPCGPVACTVHAVSSLIPGSSAAVRRRPSSPAGAGSSLGSSVAETSAVGSLSVAAEVGSEAGCGGRLARVVAHRVGVTGGVVGLRTAAGQRDDRHGGEQSGTPAQAGKEGHEA